MFQTDYDAVIVGAGFAGIYQAYKLVSQGLSVKVIDQAGDVGGTWYWNKYPGAMSDTESFVYRFSWDKDDLQQYHWRDHYVKQPEALAYLNHVVDRYDLRQFMQFNTQLISADFDDRFGLWRIKTSNKDSASISARYLITALGLLSKQNYPDISGLSDFKGELYHTGRWPSTHDFKNKRVAVIGNGSTGVQVITAIAKADEVAQLTSFQRHPQYSVPSGDGPVTRSYRDEINSNYDTIWNQVRNSDVGFGFQESTVPCMSVTPEEREKIFQAAWDKGNGFRFMFWTFNDITTSTEANEEACKFIRRKINETVHDPEKARILTPTDLYARRPLCDAGYYEQFNRPNVSVVDIQSNPISHITSTGITLSDNTHHDFDVIILATGFDAVDGNYTRLAIKGRSGTLADHWATSGPRSYLGMFVSEFPNFAMVMGPNSAFTNNPPCIEAQVDFISRAIERAEHSLDWTSTKERGRHGSIGSRPVIEVTGEAEAEWTQVCEEESRESLFRKTQSWIFGANVPGKKVGILFYFGGLRKYRAVLERVEQEEYEGFVPF